MSTFVHFHWIYNEKNWMQRNIFHWFFFCGCEWKLAWDFFLWAKKLKITWLQQRRITTDETFTGKPGQWKKKFMYLWMRRRKQVSVHGGESTIPHFMLNPLFPGIVIHTMRACVWCPFASMYVVSQKNIVVVNKNKLELERAGKASNKL